MSRGHTKIALATQTHPQAQVAKMQPLSGIEPFDLMAFEKCRRLGRNHALMPAAFTVSS